MRSHRPETVVDAEHHQERAGPDRVHALRRRPPRDAPRRRVGPRVQCPLPPEGVAQTLAPRRRDAPLVVPPVEGRRAGREGAGTREVGPLLSELVTDVGLPPGSGRTGVDLPRRVPHTRVYYPDRVRRRGRLTALAWCPDARGETTSPGTGVTLLATHPPSGTTTEGVFLWTCVVCV